ncbi:GrpB family protein [Achromobacter ruhlandii]|uniref:GrpB family protein n=1 Tax=Achromobacter ruhlandii TaxID=72557 RepID=UPI000C25A81E|nr:GrpB family protein [Achromobacter ruhlandii]PJM87469.1 hypothetical protein CV044_19860 [Achromobacter ruhlandii]
MPTPQDIMRHYDSDPDEDPWVRGKPAPEPVRVAPYDPESPALYARLAADIGAALGAALLRIDHVGSTAVPGLLATPALDIDVALADPADEPAYVPALEAIGYLLVIREPSWHQHRCLQRAAPRVNLHVFGPDCPENIRHRMFRDWLRDHDDDRDRYAQAKHAAARGVDQVADYNLRKQAVIRDIYERMFRAAGFI